MGTPEPPDYGIEVVTGPGTLRDIQHLLERVWAAHEVPEQVRMHMELAASEVGTNIIEHAGHGRPVRLRVTVEVGSTTVTATFIDDGHPPRGDMSEPSIPDGLADRGRGLAIAHRVLDNLTYHRDTNHNHWTLTHHRKQ